MRNSAVRAAPIPKPMSGSATSGSAFKLHAIVDHSIVEIIINDEIAFVVYVAPYSRDTLGNVRAFGSGNIITDIWKLNDANVN